MLASIALAQRLYAAFAHLDAPALDDLLSNDFVGTVSDGMPHGVGGIHHGPVDMVKDVWGRIATRDDRITALHQITDTRGWERPPLP